MAVGADHAAMSVETDQSDYSWSDDSHIDSDSYSDSDDESCLCPDCVLSVDEMADADPGTRQECFLNLNLNCSTCAVHVLQRAKRWFRYPAFFISSYRRLY